MVRIHCKKARVDTESPVTETTNIKQRKIDDPGDNDLAVGTVMSEQILGNF